jgi:hypothetical protein
MEYFISFDSSCHTPRKYASLFFFFLFRCRKKPFFSKLWTRTVGTSFVSHHFCYQNEAFYVIRLSYLESAFNTQSTTVRLKSFKHLSFFSSKGQVAVRPFFAQNILKRRSMTASSIAILSKNLTPVFFDCKRKSIVQNL